MKVNLSELVGNFDNIIASSSFEVPNGTGTKRIIMRTAINMGRKQQAKTTVSYIVQVEENTFEKLEHAVDAFNNS